MSKRRAYIGLDGGAGGGRETNAADQAAWRQQPHPCWSAHMFWTVGAIILLFVAIGIAAAALVYAMTDDAHWAYDDAAARITSRYGGADVEVAEGGNLVVHSSIIDSFEHTVYEKTVLNPLFGPEGVDMLFGAADAMYARLQAEYAIGLRVWDRFFIPIGGVFASNGLFGEDALAVVVGTFATWVHGPIIGTGPAILVISDAGAKENVQSLDAQVALGKVAHLEPRSFDWKGARSADATKLAAKTRQSMRNVHGFVAQEVGAIIPAAVHNTNDFLPEGTDLPPQALMDYNAIIVELVGAVQSLWANGVVAAGSPPSSRDAAMCFNATVYTTHRATARCICETSRCGPDSRLPQCRNVENACGRVQRRQ